MQVAVGRKGVARAVVVRPLRLLVLIRCSLSGGLFARPGPQSPGLGLVREERKVYMHLRGPLVAPS